MLLDVTVFFISSHVSKGSDQIRLVFSNPFPLNSRAPHFEIINMEKYLALKLVWPTTTGFDKHPVAPGFAAVQQLCFTA